MDAQYRLAFIEYQSAVTNQGGDVAEGPRDAGETRRRTIRTIPTSGRCGRCWAIFTAACQPTEKENFTEMAMKAYMAAVDKAKTPDVLDYAIDAATNILTSENKWQELATMWQTYYTNHKEQPQRAARPFTRSRWPTAAWASPRRRRNSWPITSRRTWAIPKNEQVEMLIQQLVGMIVPKKRGRPRRPRRNPPSRSRPRKRHRQINAPARRETGGSRSARPPDAAKPAEAATRAPPRRPAANLRGTRGPAEETSHRSRWRG